MKVKVKKQKTTSEVPKQATKPKLKWENMKSNRVRNFHIGKLAPSQKCMHKTYETYYLAKR